MQDSSQLVLFHQAESDVTPKQVMLSPQQHMLQQVTKALQLNTQSDAFAA